MPPPNLYAHVQHFVATSAHETAGAARTRSSLRPLFQRSKVFLQNSGRIAPRDREGVFSFVARMSAATPGTTLSPTRISLCSSGLRLFEIQIRTLTPAAAGTPALSPRGRLRDRHAAPGGRP